MRQKNWSREETIVAFNVYCKIPFKSSSKTNSTIIKYANIINRSSSALNMKVGNFGRLDPELRKQGIVGLSHGSKLEEDVWNEFHRNWEGLAYESERLIAQFQGKSIEETIKIDLTDLLEGKERESVIKTRVNQSFFRSAVLSSYNQKCCITGLSVPELLIASHIIPWSVNKKNRLNPSNGLCLNALHDKAFDKGFITISKDLKVVVSKLLTSKDISDEGLDFIRRYENRNIYKPDKFYPLPEFLEYHKRNIFRG